MTPLIFLILTVIRLCRDHIGPKTPGIMLTAALCFGLVKTLGIANPVNFLSADIGIAAFFAACLLAAMFEKNTRLAALFLAVALPAFTLLKSTCVLFSLTVVLVFFVRAAGGGIRKTALAALGAGALCLLAVMPLLAWDQILAARAIAPTTSHLNLTRALAVFSRMEPPVAATLLDMARYFFMGPVIAVYPAFLRPLAGTFALLVYSTALFALAYKREKGRQLAWLFCLLAAFAGWLLIYALVITLVLPDALADYIVDFTYPRYVGPFICPVFMAAILAHALPRGREALRRGAGLAKAASVAVIAALPLYAVGIYQRAHPPIRHQAAPLAVFQEESEEKWAKMDAARDFIIRNTPDGARIWTLLDESSTSRHFVQMGFYLRPRRDNHVRLDARPGMPGGDIRRALLENGVTHVFVLSPGRRPLREFGDVVALPPTPCPVLADIRPWRENAEASAVIFEDAWWCEQKRPRDGEAKAKGRDGEAKAAAKAEAVDDAGNPPAGTGDGEAKAAAPAKAAAGRS